MAEFLTTREVAVRLGVQEWQIENALRRREVGRPPVLGGVRIWDEALVAKLLAALVERGQCVLPTRGSDA